MAAKKFTPQEIATLKAFNAYAKKGGNEVGSKGYSERLSTLTSNIRYEMANTKQLSGKTKPSAKTPAKPLTLKEKNAASKAKQKEKNAARLAEIKRRNAAAKAKSEARFK